MEGFGVGFRASGCQVSGLGLSGFGFRATHQLQAPAQKMQTQVLGSGFRANPKPAIRAIARPEQLSASAQLKLETRDLREAGLETRRGLDPGPVQTLPGLINR